MYLKLHPECTVHLIELIEMSSLHTMSINTESIMSGYTVLI